MNLYERVFCETAYGAEQDFMGPPPAEPGARRFHRTMGRLAAEKPAFVQHPDPEVRGAAEAHGRRYQAHLERQIAGRQRKGKAGGREEALRRFKLGLARARDPGTR